MGQTPLLVASQQGHVAVCELLLNRGADVDKAEETVRIWDGERMGTELHRASVRGDLTKVERLLDCGADVNWQDKVWDILY